MRIPRQQASSTAALDGVVRSKAATGGSNPVPGAQLTLRNLQTGQRYTSIANGEGLFRIFPLAPGHYELNVEAAGAESFVLHDLALRPNEVVTLEISLAQTGHNRKCFATSAASRIRACACVESAGNGGNLSRTAASPRFRSRLHSGARARLSASGCRCL